MKKKNQLQKKFKTSTQRYAHQMNNLTLSDYLRIFDCL